MSSSSECNHLHSAFEILDRKIRNNVLPGCAIKWFIDNVVSGVVEKSQLGAFLASVCINGMNAQEIADLTKAMATSGDSLTWESDISPYVVDKHSTGGVGDKVSIVLAPALAACGLFCPSIAGRGLGLTGGTIDKLEAIPGMKFEYTIPDIEALTKKSGCCIVSQSKNLNPADKTLYATRDVTATVANIPLITSSIMSKKYCERPSSLLLDVKCGKSAFMNSLEDAYNLAESIVNVGKILNVKTIVMITQMDNPIGVCIGNSLETEESLETLKGRGHPDLLNLVYQFGAQLLLSSNKVGSEAEGISAIKNVLANGKALEKFNQMIQAQGVEPSVANKLIDGKYADVFGRAKHTYLSKVKTSGYIKSINSSNLANVVRNIGGGRLRSDDKLDYQVGIRLKKHIGNHVNVGDVWCHVEYNVDPEKFTYMELIDDSIVTDDVEVQLDRILAKL